jgi:O-antigen ligase
MHINKIYFTKKSVINILISLFPFFIILGNLAININILAISILGIAIYGTDTFKVNKKISIYFLYSFFFYLILITLIKNLPNLNVNDLYGTHIIKSFFFLRFLIFFLVIVKLLEKNDFNIKIFFTSGAFFSFIVGVDILIQVAFDKNILGLPVINQRPSSFFGGELVAGGFMQKFSLFFIFLLFYFKKEKNSKKINFFLILVFLLFFTSILLTNNKMSLIIFLSSIILFFLIEKKFKTFVTFIFLTLITLTIIAKTLPHGHYNDWKNYTKVSLNTMYVEAENILKMAPKLFFYEEYTDARIAISQTNYLFVFNSGVQIWKKNKFFGNGLKSYRLNCNFKINQICSTHPHNYIIEIMVDTGIVGLALIYLLFIFSISNFLKFYFKNFNSREKFLFVPFFLIIFFEFFPIRSSGSFFSTSNATIIFLMLALLFVDSRSYRSK